MPRAAVEDNQRMSLRLRPEQKAMLVCHNLARDDADGRVEGPASSELAQVSDARALDLLLPSCSCLLR